MKKVFISLLVAVLVLAIAGGSVYAAIGHTYPPGKKLVGLGPLGTMAIGAPPPIMMTNSTNFNFTNPNCDKSITITQVSILRQDGSVVYQGPYLDVSSAPPTSRTINSNPMGPHESRSIMLQFYMPKSSPLINPSASQVEDFNTWKVPPQALAQNMETYTVEIFWKPTGRHDVNPLIGFAAQNMVRYQPEAPMDWLHELSSSLGDYEMVNTN